MAENLKTTKFNDGTSIPLVTGHLDWLELTTPAYRWYYNDEARYGNTYGALYNWFTINTGDLCPSGWHVPTDDDWKELESTLGMMPTAIDSTGYRGDYIGSRLAGNADLWRTEELEFLPIELNDHFGSSCFEALPGGEVDFIDLLPGLRTEGIMGIWWSATEFDSQKAWFRKLQGTTNSVYRFYRKKRNGYSVRCVRD